MPPGNPAPRQAKAGRLVTVTVTVIRRITPVTVPLGTQQHIAPYVSNVTFAKSDVSAGQCSAARGRSTTHGDSQ